MIKVTVLYGDNITASRSRMVSIIESVKKRGWEVLRQIHVSNSLFAKERLFVIEDVKKLKKEDLVEDMNLLIWQKNQLPSGLKKILPKDTKYEEFKLPVLIWKFLDTLSLELFHKALETESVELVFALLGRQVRDLYWVKQDTSTFQGPSWRKGKLASQAAKYSESTLTRIIKKLADIDIAAKTGTSDLTRSLDLLIMKELE